MRCSASPPPAGGTKSRACACARTARGSLASVTFTALRDPAGSSAGVFRDQPRPHQERRSRGRSTAGCSRRRRTRWWWSIQRGEIVLLNVQAEKQFGYRRDELLGQQVTNIIPEGFAERLIADDLRSAEDALAQQIGTGIELIGRRKDGSEFPIEIMLSPLESADGILVTAAIRDISVRKAAETAPGADGGPLPRPARGGARRDGGGQPGAARSSCSTCRPRSSSATAATNCSASRSPTSFPRASPSG